MTAPNDERATPDGVLSPARGLAAATDHGWIGPWPAREFTLAPPAAIDRLTPSERFYFEGECVAVPVAGIPVAGYALATRATTDIREWRRHRAAGGVTGRAPLILLGAPLRCNGAQLDATAQTITIDGRTSPFRLAPRLPLNRSWFDASSAAYFASRSIRIRASLDRGTVVARTLWPEDFSLAGVVAPAPLAPALPVALALRERMREDPRGGAELPFAVHGLWERAGWTGCWKDKPVLAVVVNGAQGDDDEAWAGHFAIATGRVSANGSIADLLVNNFYALDFESEKGILAAPVPLDAYLGDLNRGQAWYRPSSIVVAALESDEALALAQAGFDRTFRQFWRHQLAYRHSTMNCAGICVDVLRALGLPVAVRQPARRWRAWLALPWIALRQRSLFKGRMVCEYLLEDVTRLLPAAAFEEVCATLLSLAASGHRESAGAGDRAGGDGPSLAGLLARDLDAIALLRIPQFPSSRRFGSWPVVSPDEYFAAIPGNPADMEIVPVPPRPFPAGLRDADLLPPPREPSDLPLATWILVVVLLVAVLAVTAVRLFAA